MVHNTQSFINIRLPADQHHAHLRRGQVEVRGKHTI